MSRGWGRVQRKLYEAVKRRSDPSRPDLWVCVTELDLGIAEHPESRRRAAHLLARDGALELHTAAGVGLFARLPCDDYALAKAEELRQQYEQRLVRVKTATGAEYEELWQWIDDYEEPQNRENVYIHGLWQKVAVVG